MTQRRLEIVESALAEAEEALTNLRARIRALKVEEEALMAEVDGLRLAVSAHHPQPQKESLGTRILAATGKVVDAFAQMQEYREAWRQLPRTAAIEYVFAEVARPMHRQEVETHLRIRGREDSAGAISAALSYLKRIGRAESLGGGRWVVRSPRRDAPFELRDLSTAPALAYTDNGSEVSDGA